MLADAVEELETSGVGLHIIMMRHSPVSCIPQQLQAGQRLILNRHPISVRNTDTNLS